MIIAGQPVSQKDVRLQASGVRFLLKPVALISGEGGIRTPDAGITDVTVFETAAFNHSATSPLLSVSTRPHPFNHPLSVLSAGGFL
jgi:hypothetical protein